MSNPRSSRERFAFQGVECNVERLREGDGESVLLCVHGFSGSAEDWRAFADALNSDVGVFAIDLPGFGESDRPRAPEPYTEEFLIALLDAALERTPAKRLVTAGYSMGGRLALAHALAYPDRLDGLVLIGATPGIRDAAEREARRRADEELARYIESRPIEAFVERWENLPIFETRKRLPQSEREGIRQKKLRNDPVALARSLRGFGTGATTPLWERLGELSIPTALVTGALDEKYCKINEETLTYLAFGVRRTISDAGHATIDEKPEATAAAVEEFLSRNEFKQ